MLRYEFQINVEKRFMLLSVLIERLLLRVGLLLLRFLVILSLLGLVVKTC
jgi:hypothetical protein